MKKYGNIVFWSVSALLVLGGLILMAKPDSQNVSDTSDVIAGLSGPVSHDFSSISMAAGKVSYDYELTNETGEVLEISKLYTSCMCTEAFFVQGEKTRGPFGMPGHGLMVPSLDASLTPFEKATVRVVFDPAAHGPAGLGQVQRVVHLETNKGMHDLQFAAGVIP